MKQEILTIKCDYIDQFNEQIKNINDSGGKIIQLIESKHLGGFGYLKFIALVEYDKEQSENEK